MLIPGFTEALKTHLKAMTNAQYRPSQRSDTIANGIGVRADTTMKAILIAVAVDWPSPNAPGGDLLLASF